MTEMVALTLDRFHLLIADRNTEESAKRKGRGIVVFVNNKWCNIRKISVKEKLCVRDIDCC